MGEQHLDLLALAAGDGIGLGGGNVARQIPSTFIDGARHLARRLFRTATRLQGASLAIVFARAVEERRAVVHHGSSGRQLLAAGAAVGVGRGIEGEVAAREGVIGALGLVEYRNVGSM